MSSRKNKRKRSKDQSSPRSQSSPPKFKSSKRKKNNPQRISSSVIYNSPPRASMTSYGSPPRASYGSPYGSPGSPRLRKSPTKQIGNNKHRNNKENPSKLSDLVSEDGGTLKLYRAGDKGPHKIYDGVSFYGISKYGIQSYTTQHSPIYFDFVLTKKETGKIVDLGLDQNYKKIKKWYDNKASPENKNLIEETLLFGENVNHIVRHSIEKKNDIKMAKILEQIFPNKIGSYTRPGLGLNHGEVIIWDKKINTKLHGLKTKQN